VNILNVEPKQKKVEMPKIKKRIVVVQTETKPRNSHGFQCGRRRICGNLA
jgi:hypothetical protein